MTQTLKPLLAALLTGLALAGCGGGGGGGSSSDSGSGTGTDSGSGNGSGSGGTTTSACAGTVYQTLDYAVYSGAGSATPATVAASLHGSGSTAASQCLELPGLFSLSTTDGFADQFSWTSATGTSLSAGAARLEQGVLLTCSAGTDLTRHLAVKAAGKVEGAAAVAAVLGQQFSSLECSAGQVLSGATALGFNADGSVTVTDRSSSPAETTTLDAAAVTAAFGSGGHALTADGVTRTLRLSLYTLSTGGTARQALVFTAEKSDSSAVNPFVFLPQ